MGTRRHLALLSSGRNPLSPDQRIYHEILSYLDERHWPVKVWYHDRMPGWIRGNFIFANLWYAIRLWLVPQATLLLDYRLFPFLALALWSTKRTRGHEVLIYVKREYQQVPGRPWGLAGYLLWRIGLHCADLVVADSVLTRKQLLEQGVKNTPIRILHPLQSFLSLTYGRQDDEDEDEELEIIDLKNDEISLPDSLAEVFEIMDLEKLFQPADAKVKATEPAVNF